MVIVIPNAERAAARAVICNIKIKSVFYFVGNGFHNVLPVLYDGKAAFDPGLIKCQSGCDKQNAAEDGLHQVSKEPV